MIGFVVQWVVVAAAVALLLWLYVYLAVRYRRWVSHERLTAREEISAGGGLPSGPPEPPEPQDAPLAHQEALPADPLHPPTVKTYQPRSGAPVRSCTCHNRPLTPGQQVVWWPVPDSGGAVWVFCREGIGVPE